MHRRLGQTCILLETCTRIWNARFITVVNSLFRAAQSSMSDHIEVHSATPRQCTTSCDAILIVDSQCYVRCVLATFASTVFHKICNVFSVLCPPPFMDGGQLVFGKCKPPAQMKWGGARPPYFSAENSKWGGQKFRKLHEMGLFFTCFWIFFDFYHAKSQIFARFARGWACFQYFWALHPR